MRNAKHEWQNLRRFIVSALFFLISSAGGSPVLQCMWETKQVLTTQLCFSPEAELHTGVQIADIPYSEYRRQAMALTSGLFRRQDQEDEHLFQAQSVLTTGQAAQITDPASLFRRIYKQDIILSASMLEQGVSNFGDTTNLRRAFLKLVTGHPIKMVMLGGSITVGHGPRDGQNAWVTRIENWINTTFPHPGHIFLNKAVPAVTSSYISPCVQNLVPEDTDLVLVEFTFNDSERTKSREFEDPTRRGLERLLRKLMRMQGQPAIVYVHYWAGLMMRRFIDTAEDAIDIVLKYYGITAYSMRDALHQAVEDNPALKQQIWWSPPDTDRIHPTCVGSRFMADLVIGHFQDLAAAVLMAHIASHKGVEPLPIIEQVKPPLVSDLRPPVLSNNWGNLTETCMLDDTFKALVRPIIGFEWINEGKPGGSPKWGYVSVYPGAKLEIDVPVSGLVMRKNTLVVGLGFLMSYAHMGMAMAQCVSGCSCDPHEFSFTHQYVSMTIWKTMDVEISAGSQVCGLSVTVMERTKSNPPEHKVKLTSIMLSGETGFIDTWSRCNDCI